MLITFFIPFLLHASVGTTCCDNTNDEVECHRVMNGKELHIFYGFEIVCDEEEEPVD
ncbi:hypothetical protein [Belliella pelovolcani]|uniref:hypothetical protein n=1 Tax=Belliella pelovolcani TaxID=529505 RepID=UPI00391B1A16